MKKIGSETVKRYQIMWIVFDPRRPIWMKFGIGNIHTILLSIREFRENRFSESCTFLTCEFK